jgi:hypothetical protein
MFDLTQRLRRTFSTTTAPSRKRPRRLGLEVLESRTVPTILFTPHFTGTVEYAPSDTTIAQEQADSLSSPSVVFVFTGSYWQTTQGQNDQAHLSLSMQTILNSGYLAALDQYGSDGKAYYYGSWQDNNTPTLAGATPDDSGLQAYVQAEISSHPGAAPAGSNVIYVVVNTPQVSAQDGATHGYNTTNGTLHAVYVGAVALASGALDIDHFTQVFSHELAESMVPSVHVSDPGALGLGYQIADGEPEAYAPGYAYRLANGCLVQAYWSQRDGAWIVPDGNSQQFTLSWATTGFTNAYNLQVSGDAAGANATTNITVNRSSSTASTTVTIDGQQASFPLSTIPSLNISTAASFTVTVGWGSGQSLGTVSATGPGSYQVTGSQINASDGTSSFTVQLAGVSVTGSGPLGVTLTPNQVYISALYQDLLHRPADSGGLSYWSNLLDRGLPRSTVANALDHSDEYFAALVQRTYQQDLGRAADAGGLAFWTGQLRNGLTDEQLSALIVSCNEAYVHAGSSAKSWVDALYQSLLGRTADFSGEAFWVQQLMAGVSRTAVAYTIAANAEHASLMVRQAYQQYLGRDADPGSLTYWIHGVQNGLTDELLVSTLVSSNEYFQKHTTPGA